MESAIKHHIDTKPQYKKDRLLYIIQATVEYFITIMVGSTYLAKVAIEIGMDDASIALLSSVLQFSYAFQLVTMFFNRFKHPKRWITPFLIVIEISFTFVYVIPIAPIPSGLRPFLLAASVVIGNALHNITSVAKSSWMIGFVADDNRGKFTAVMQSISLLSGIAVSYGIGAIIDSYEARGDIRGAFVVMGIVIAAFSVIHVILFLCTKEIANDGFVNVSVLSQAKEIAKNKNLLKIIPIYVIWHVAQMCSTPFYYTYQIKELGFNMTFIAVLSAISAIIRSLASVQMGKYGDKHGFVKALNIAFIFALAAFSVNIITSPANGHVLYTIYIVLMAICSAGVGVAETNLIFEYAPLDTRVGALAIKGTLSGIVSFLTTLAATPLVNFIQSSGNKIFGISVYAQQVMSLIAAVVTVLLLVYVNTVAKTAKNRHEA